MNGNFSFDESVNTDSIQDYFANLIKKTDKNAQNVFISYQKVSGINSKGIQSKDLGEIER